MSDIVIDIKNLSKQYQLGVISTRTLSRDFESTWARFRGKEDPNSIMTEKNSLSISNGEERVWALKDIDLQVQFSEILGIIGKNGAGKSTLLKILARITSPTNGKVKIKGRLASLLEVGTGFHPELTGRENIYLNGAILGMTKKEINHKMEEIIDFSGVEKYIDTPVKRYSSGMHVRLAFSIAAHLESDILLIDEVLAVGDAEFQKKCLGKMGQFASDGRTILFVSHNMAAVSNLCDRGILLQEGEIIMEGEIQKVINNYLNYSNLKIEKDLTSLTDRRGNGNVQFTEIYLQDKDGINIESGISGEELNIVMKYRSKHSDLLPNSRLSLAFYSNQGEILFNCSTELTSKDNITLAPNGEVTCSISQLPLSDGDYFIAPFIEVNSDIEDWIEGIKISVIGGDYFGTGKLFATGWKGKGVLINHNWVV